MSAECLQWVIAGLWVGAAIGAWLMRKKCRKEIRSKK